MKVKAKQEQLPKIFLPVELNITFETQEELGRFYAIFNHTVISEFLDPHDYKASEIRQSISIYTGDKYNDYWDELDTRIQKNG